MKSKILFISIPFVSILLFSCQQQSICLPSKMTLTKEKLLDKIKGGWAGQTIGVTYGGETEFKYNGTFIQDYQPLTWHKGFVKEYMEKAPGLYDDVYMDLTFVEVLEKVGMDAPVDSFAHAFAHADYDLWHANQSARYNIIKGIKNPGNWLNNPHADDIDYQIESDYAGLMNPGMPNSASKISDKIGHLINSGDGWYGGIYVGAMYSLAFVSDDVNFIINEALKTILKESEFYKCISDVINWHKKYPNDWHQAWFEIQKKYTEDKGCPEGVFNAFNIDAKVNAAYVVMGLLYGQGDYTKTLNISTRCGFDSDCNPATAGGILGTILGYSKIPQRWMDGLENAEDLNFKYTDMSLKKVYQIGEKHALYMIKKNGGTINGDRITINVKQPKAVRFEQNFTGIYPVKVINFSNNDKNPIEFKFEGTGFVLRGVVQKKFDNAPDGELKATLYIDGQKIETADFPTSNKYRRQEIFWKYKLPFGNHEIRIEYPSNEYYGLKTWNYIVYSNKSIEEQ